MIKSHGLLGGCSDQPHIWAPHSSCLAATMAVHSARLLDPPELAGTAGAGTKPERGLSLCSMAGAQWTPTHS